MQNKIFYRSDLFSNDQLLEKEFYNHIFFSNFDRLRIFSFFIVPFALINLFADFYLRGLWQKGQLDYFVQLDIILFICSLIVVYLTNFQKPKTEDDVKPWMIFFIYAYVFLQLMWGTAISIVEEPTSNSLPTYLISVYSIVLLFYINSTFLICVLILSIVFVFLGLTSFGKSFDEILAKYYFTLALIILAWFIAKILFKSKLTTFTSTKQLENSKNQLDKKVKERTEELQLMNEQLTNEISERNKYERILEREKKKAEEADNLKSIFLANMSHEIRTPLNGILGFSDLLYKQNLPQQKINRYLDIIHNNGHQLLKIIDDILDISMIASNQLSINKVNFRLSYIFPDAFEFFNRQKKIDNKEEIEIIYNPITYESKDDIYSDPVRIQQILNNLIHNSLKFTEKGFIRFSGKIENEYALIFVEDSGIGVDFNRRKDIFKRFRQGDESSNRLYGGTGLGLSISKGIVELLGGMIWIDTNYVNGSRFCFSIPLKEQNSENLPNQPGFYENLRKKRLLLIENKYNEYSFLTESFKDLKIINYRTELSKISVDLTSFNPDLIIFDMVEQVSELDELILKVKSYCPGVILFCILPQLETNSNNQIIPDCDKIFYRPINLQLLFTQCLKSLTQAED